MASCLLLIGSCNESSTTLSNFEKKSNNFSSLSWAERVKYGYALQDTIIQSAANLKKLKIEEVKLALSAPNRSYQEGEQNLWQYVADSCVLDIYWTKAESVTHYEIRQRMSILNTTTPIYDPVEWQCVQEVIQSRRRSIQQGFKNI